ncbi:MAG: MotA/TolQ/ExbB proton channel family protein [Opitutales bacterium]
MQTLLKPFLLAAAGLLAFQSGVRAESFDAANAQAQRDLEKALTELNDVRENIASEKIPLIREVSSLEDEVRQKSGELDRLLRLRDNRDVGLNRLRNQVEAMEEQNNYAAGLLDEFVRSFETRIDFSERHLYEETAEEARLALEDPNMSQADQFNTQIEVIGAAVERLGKLVGGYTYEGLALAPNGDILEGTFASFGPSVYFASANGELEGVAITKLNAAEAAIAVPHGDFGPSIRQFIESGEGSIPVDATLGKALKIDQQRDSMLEHINKGGVVGWVIIGLGLVCLLIGLFKIFEVTGVKTPAAEAVQSVIGKIESGDLAGARKETADMPGIGGELIKTGLEHAEEKRGTLEEILYERIISIRPKLERLLPFMALTAAAAPLLGLLGTVTGMISTFNLITIFGTGDAGNLASGISQALVTTELGLIVAIPSLILHGLLSRMARQKVGDLEQAAVGFINGVIGSRHSDS